jgi:transposase
MELPLPEVEASPEAPVRPQAVRGGKRFVALPDREQLSLAPRCLDELVPPDAFVRLFDAILEVCDFTAFEARHPGGGRPAFPPQLLCKLLLYGQCVSVRSARELSRRLERDTHFMWLAHELTVDHETLSNFRRDCRQELQGVFQQVVRLGVWLGLAKLEHISLDGTKLAARAARRAYDEQSLQAALQRLDARIAELTAEAEALDAAEDARYGRARGDELPAALQQAEARREQLQQAQALLAQSPFSHLAPGDPEAPVQKTPDGKRPGYNGQLAVDAEVGFVVGAALVCDQNDTAQFLPLAQQVIANTGQTPQEFAADSGYHSPETLQALAESELNGYISQQPTPRPDGRFGQEAFTYDAAGDSYVCPAGRRLTYRGLKTMRRVPSRRYRAEHSCAHCPQRAQCISAKARYRELLVAPHAALLQEMRDKVASPEGQRALQLRKQTVERTFGTIKAQLGLRQFLLRGREGAQVEFLLGAMAVNVRKLAQWLGAGGSPEQLRQAATAAAAHALGRSLRSAFHGARRLLSALRGPWHRSEPHLRYPVAARALSPA